MKKTLLVVAVLLTLNLLRAQSAPNGAFVMLQAGTPASCAWPTGATFSNAMALCATSSGLYYALNGSTTFVPVGAALPTQFTCPSGSVGNAGINGSGCTFK